MSDFSPIPIIRSKLYQPRSTPDLISRGRLLAANPVGVSGAVTLVSAPAGYGKSTFVSQCVAASERQCAWLSLDTTDSDPRRFLSYLVAALRTVVPDCCRGTVECLQVPTLMPLEELTGILCNDLDQLSEPVVLVLDDYYQISASEVHTLVNAIIKRPPKSLHVVIITRRDPPLSLQLLRASSMLAEIRMQQLAFTAGETHDFIRQSLGDEISDEAIARLHQRAEGWPAALRLATLAVAASNSADALVDNIPGDIHAVREYLLHEVLANRSPEVREYLFCTAFLDRYCAPLCEVVLPGDSRDSVKVTGKEFIKLVRESGLFSIALDSRQKWFRYHHLFQAMLREQALAEFGHDEVRKIHVRASRWFEERDFLEEAILHLLQADMLSETAMLIIRNRNTIMNNEQWDRLDGWFRLLPSDMVAARPELLLLKARFLRTRGSREESWQTLERAEALLKGTEIDWELRQELHGSLESSRCYQFYVMSNGSEAVDAARRALELLPDDSLAERGFAFIILAAALQMIGETELAKETLYAAMSDGSSAEGMNVTFNGRVLLALGFVQWMDADLNALGPTAEQGSVLAGSAELRETLAVARSFQGAILYHRNELADVRACLRNITHSDVVANAEFYAQCLFISSLTHQELGNTAKATKDSGTVYEFALKTQNAFLIAQAEAFNAEIALRQGRMAEAQNWADRYDPEPFTPMYSFYSPSLTLAKVLVLEDSDESRERAGILLGKLVDYLTWTHNKRFLIEALALRALLLDATGDSESAVEDLANAVSMALPARFIRLFVDIGPRLCNVLNRLDLDDEGLKYVGEILAVFRESDAEPASVSTIATSAYKKIGVEPLSRREQQILDLIANRLSNKEIAGKLNISPVTVKRHAANIYQKLGVHSRRQAVAKATGLGMLGRTE